ncbi:MAG TPA: hypothetical protein DDW30_08325 [Clostridiales bacterium]|nr:hypothetical protein [Clostridiales bacterium]
MEAHFIKPDIPFEAGFHREDHAPLFRRCFDLTGPVRRATLSVCALGIGYCFVNGSPVSDDLFCAPVSDYRKTLWYNTYDVTGLLCEGKNVVAVQCGNGRYHESFRTVWSTEGEVSDHPKVTLTLTVNGREVLRTDGSWKCRPDSAVRFNQLRSGEWFDATRYEADWASLAYDDSAWHFARVDDTPPTGVLRECRCEPIREFEVTDPVAVLQTGAQRFVYDFGGNRAGYIRLTAAGVRGQLLTIRYAESLNPDNTLRIYGLSRFYPESEFMTDRFTCSGEEVTWSPRFTYHGFRYLEIEGITDPAAVRVQAVFVHQAVRVRTSFHCSEELLNRLFAAGQTSSLSNLFYQITDCPTREKYGWTDDAQMSAEQLFTDFGMEALTEKWMTDICDAMREDGCLPGIVPTNGWGYGWGNGPLSDGVLFELPYRYYLHTGKGDLLVQTLPYFLRYLAFLEAKADADGLVTDFGLGDWATAGSPADIPLAFVNAALTANFYRITALAQRLAGDRAGEAEMQARLSMQRARIARQYLREDGSCCIDRMAAVAILLALALCDRPAPLAKQLRRLVRENGCRHDCGILGLRCLLHALSAHGGQEDAYRLVTASGYPSYRYWLDSGATSLWEYFTKTIPNGEYTSENHHMYSDVLSWMVKQILGIRHDRRDPQAAEFTLKPFYFRALTFAEGSYASDSGTLSVAWRREADRVRLTVRVRGSTAVRYKDCILTEGDYTFSEPTDEKEESI